MQAIPMVLTGRDVIIHSGTGSGKTLAFVLPILKLFQSNPPSANPSVIVIEPARELAAQVMREFSYFMCAPLVKERSPHLFYDTNLDPVRTHSPPLSSASLHS